MTSSILKVFQSTLNSAYIMSEDMNSMDMMKAFKITLGLQEHLFETMMQMLSLSSHSMKSNQSQCECSCKSSKTKKSLTPNFLLNSQSTSSQAVYANSSEEATLYQDSNSCVASETQSSTPKLSDEEKVIPVDSSDPELATTADASFNTHCLIPVKQEFVEDDSNDSFIDAVQNSSASGMPRIMNKSISLWNRRSHGNINSNPSYSERSFPLYGKRLRNQERIGQQYRRYDRSKLDEATRLVLAGKMSAYKASLMFQIPSSTIHDASVRLKSSLSTESSS